MTYPRVGNLTISSGVRFTSMPAKYDVAVISAMLTATYNNDSLDSRVIGVSFEVQ